MRQQFANWLRSIHFLYQKLNGGRNGHFLRFNCCWYRMWIFYVCPRFLIAAHDLRWHVRDTNNVAFSVLHVWICMRLSIQNCLFETYKTTCVSSEETNQTYNLLNIWFDWCFSNRTLFKYNHMCRSHHDSIVILCAFWNKILRVK